MDLQPPGDAEVRAAVRVDRVTSALEDLRVVLAEEEPLEAVMRRLVETAEHAVPDADAVSITLLDLPGNSPRTCATTDPAVADVDIKQYETGAGPCLLAAETRQPVRTDVHTAREQWPDFAGWAAAIGMRAYLCCPLVLDVNGDLVGALNLYSRAGDAFQRLDVALIRLLASSASAAVAGYRRYQQTRTLADQLQQAIASRAVIEQAKGALMAGHGLDEDQAFAVLLRHSQDSNTKLRDVAGQLIESLRQRR